ncbi:MAG TPA: HlyD family type I secretion periplasmic adaptor subunit [Devosiaceae bacterium]|jgi:HlyD family secretion protein|nr:HlyD family type I secretion periplasmic adaptor subunit [Devosiaceae bacterium]
MILFGGKGRAKKAGAAPNPAAPPRPKLRLVPPARQPAIMEFQTDAIELEERKPPVLARLTLYAVVLCIVSGVYWASVSNIDEIVVAPGKLITTDPVLVVQPLETSVIRSINIKPGDVVSKGQPLATLDPTFSTADVDQLQAKRDNLDAQIGRIEAELAGRLYRAPDGASKDQLTQADLAEQRAAFFKARLNDFDAQIAHADAMIVADTNQEAVLTQRIAGLKEIDEMNASLAERGNGSRLTYLQARDLSLDTEATLSRTRGDRAQAEQTMEQAKAERQSFIEDYRRTSMESLVDLKDKRSDSAEELKKAQLRKSMAVLVAPADGAVLDVARRSIGSVVQAAEPLFTLVPLNVPLEAEVSVAARDIGHLAVGDPARIKFDAFPFQKHGTVDGKVLSISQDSFAPQSTTQNAAPEVAFYKVRVGLGSTQLRDLPPNFRLLPGLTVEAEINAGQRSIISYFLYPLTRGLDESLHEP